MTNKTKTILRRIGLCTAGTMIAIISGAGGFLLGQHLFKRSVDYDKYNVIDEDFSEQYALYENMSQDKYYSSFTDIELVNIGLLNIQKCEHLYSICTGYVKAAGVNQNIHTGTVRDGNRYFQEDTAASTFIKAANRFYQEDGKVTWYKGKYVSPTSGDYSSSKITEYTLEEYANTWGRTLDDPCIYNVTNQCYVDSENTIDEDGNHVISIDLDPRSSVTRYVKQMMMTGNLKDAPIFHKVNLTFVLDKDVKVVSFTTNEVYDVHMIVDAKNTKGSLTQKYYYSSRSIPSINEDYNYEID